MIRVLEIKDTLDDRVQSAIYDVKNELLRSLDSDQPSHCPDLYNDLDYSGAIHEIVDSAVPIYTKEIEDLWYLYKNDFIQAYEDAGVGDNPMQNNGMAAIYYYIQQQVNDWYSDNAEDIFDEWQEKNSQEEDVDV